TAALAVSTSTIGWFSAIVSPTLTSHCRISPSVRPSPRSGRLNSLTLDTAHDLLEPERAVDGVEHPVEVGQEVLLQPRGWVRRVEARYPQHRRLERVEALLRHARRDFGTDSHVRRCLVDHDEPAGLADRREDRLGVQRRDRPEVDDLKGSPVLL